MSSEDKARAYVTAFYEAALERWLEALESAARELEQDHELQEALEAGLPDSAAQQARLDALLPAGADTPVRNLLYTLALRGDLSILSDIATGLRERMRRGSAGAAPIEVTSAVPLTGPEREALQEKLEHSFGAGGEIRYRVDASILGGIVVRAGDKLIDGSVAARLAAMRQSLGLPAATSGKT